MAAEVIGHGQCPLCPSKKARISLTSKKLACLTCGACSCQLFARSERSDELLRARIIAPGDASSSAAGDAPAVTGPGAVTAPESPPKPPPEKKPPAAAPAKSGDDWDPYA